MRQISNWIIQHPNGEYVQENWHGHIHTVPFMRCAKRYTRKVARQQAAGLIGGKAIRYDEAVATAEFDSFFPSELGEVRT